MSNKIVNTLPGLTSDDLKRLENLVGVLPPELRDFYSQHNGGEPERAYFEDDLGFENAIDGFLSALYRRHAHEVLLEEYFREITQVRREVSEKYVPFARNAGDDLYVMDRESGEVYFWAHDVPGEELRFVARSLADILRRAQTEDEFYA